MSFINYNLIPKEVRAEFYEEYIGLTPISTFMGSSQSSIIQILEINKGSGLTKTIPFKREIDYKNPVIGFDQLAGAEQQLTVYDDTIDVKMRRFADVLNGIALQKQATPVNLYEMLRPTLLTATKRNLVKSIFDTACADAASGGLYNPATETPSIDRAIYAGVDEFPESINAGAAAMTAGATAAENGLSVDHIRQLKTWATQGGAAFENENKLRPYELKTREGFPEEMYVYLMDPGSYASLVRDPDWSAYFSNGQVRTSDQPSGIYGGRFRGRIEDVMIYECPELGLYRNTSAEDITMAHNLFLGAQAFGLAWGQRPWFEMEMRDFNFNAAMAVCEIRGQKVWTFPSFQNNGTRVEHGLIHSFVRIS